MNEKNARVCIDGEPYAVKYLHIKAGKNKIPLSVTFEITRRCNFNCKMCYVHDNECKKDSLTADEWIFLAKQAKDAGALFMLITGGEPLIRDDFSYIYKEIKKLGFIVSINTNGSLITGDIASLFISDPPSRLNITLYGAGAQTYKRVTGVNAFETVCSNIIKMKKAGVDCRLNCSLTPDNAEDIEKIFAFADKNGLFIKASDYMYPKSRRADFKTGENESRFNEKQAAYYRVLINKLKYGEAEFLNRRNVMLDEIDKLKNTAGRDGENVVMCRAGSSSLWIDADGFMSACGMFNINKFDVREYGFMRSWEKVVESTAKIRLPEKCRTCIFRKICGVCAAAVLCETGGFSDAPEYICKTARYFYEYMKKEPTDD